MDRAQRPPDRDPLDQSDLYAEAEATATSAAAPKDVADPIEATLLKLVKEAESSAETYASFVRKGWNRVYRAYQNKHFGESKYNTKDYAARSKLFRPKTRGAVKKQMAATAASLFSTQDAVAIQAGNEGDPASRAGAALIQEVLNYRTSRTSGRNAIPWFRTVMGAVMDAQLTNLVVSKQYWKLEKKQTGEEPLIEPDPMTGEEFEVMEEGPDGEITPVMVPVMKTIVDRPDVLLVAPENVLIDSGADWTDPAQSSAFLILKWPMKIAEIREKEKHPTNPWRNVPDSILKQGKADRGTANAGGIRASREGGQDRFASMHATEALQTIWVYETFIRHKGEDYTFFSIGGQHMLSDPKPVEEVYPWNQGERPVIIGTASIESHRIYSMSPAESWQQLQAEINDLANLTLDTVKMNVAPIAKVKRGVGVDLDKLRHRAPGTNILMQNPETDVMFEKPPGVSGDAFSQMERLNVDFDTQAGQFDAGSVQTNRSLNETVGGMRLISGATNALQEYDQRVFIETWAEPVIGQVVRLCQYYEHDETILALCGERAKLWKKHGVDQITDQLLETQVMTLIDIGVGAGDPQQRMAKFSMAANVLMPILSQHPKFVSGEYEMDAEALIEEVFGAAGYRDGGMRFLKKNPPAQGPDPMQQAELAKKAAEAKDKEAAALEKQASAGLKEAQTEKTQVETKLAVVDTMMGAQRDQNDQDNRDADRDLHREDREFNRQEKSADRELNREGMQAKASAAGEGKKPAPKQEAAPPAANVEFIFGPDGKIAGAKMGDQQVLFDRGPDGRIAGARPMGGPAAQSPIALPPPNLRGMMAPPQGLPNFPPPRR